MADHIPDEAVTAAAHVLAKLVDGNVVPWNDLPEVQRNNHMVRARAALAAALPVLNTTKDSETVKPNLIMGNRPDGTPWVISAEFAGPAVRVDGYGALRLHGKAIAPAAAHRIATGLHAAIAWLENDGAAKAEAAASLRGEQ